MKSVDMQFNYRIKFDQAQREAHRWHRIATRLYDALTDPDMNDHDRHDAIETYLNYHNPYNNDD